MKKMLENKAVSEIIGTVLMLAFAIALFSIVSMVILAFPFSTPTPVVDIIGYVDGNDIVFEHLGGPSLNFDTNISMYINGVRYEIDVGDYIIEDINANNKWDIGERVKYNTGNLDGVEVKAYVLELESNSLILMGTLQEGRSDGSGAPPQLITSVNPISPYEQSSNPFDLTAIGDSTLDNVTLYYSWSNNNWSDSWTTLSFDDFESGFGNYTDGGNDCLLYEDGDLAYQGSNACNIQDNSGDDSSFYHTYDIDVDNPGYVSIKVDFWFYADITTPGRDFWLRYFDGTEWNTIADFNEGEDFENGQFYHKIIWINETDYIFPTNMKIKFQCDAQNDNDDIYIDEIYVNATTLIPDITDWSKWTDVGNPDTLSPWAWSFDFPNNTGYYRFYSIGKYDGDTEITPGSADAICYYNP